MTSTTNTTTSGEDGGLLTPQQVADLRLAGWHAAERGEPDEPAAPDQWREGWHLKRYGILPRTGRSPVAVLRRLVLASINGATCGALQGATS